MSDFAKHKAFAQAVAAAIREHDVYASDITFRVSGCRVFEQARMTYNQGRHGDPGSINLIVTTSLGDFPEEPKP